MEKFSLYDLLAILFPGVVFLYMLDVIRVLFGFFPDYTLTDKWELLIVLSAMMGAVVYVLSFWFVSHWKWMYRSVGMYKLVAELYLKTGIHTVVGAILNKRANEWYQKDIFYSKSDYDQQSDADKKVIEDLQDEFFDRMYYELDYADKLAVPKSFQSFYLFFRNLSLSALISLLSLGLLCLVNFLSWTHFADIDWNNLSIILLALVVILLASIVIARWYRERMVMKIYFFFYAHIYLKN